MMIDTHAHLFKNDYDDVDELINEMKDNNIYAVVCGTNKNDNEEAIELSKKYSNIFSSIGYHPTEIDDIEEDYMSYLENNYKYAVAIGEIGLDYYYRKDNKDEQISLLKNQLSFAESHNLPVIIHNRDATMDIYNILKEYNLKGVIHAFSGSYEMAQNFIKLGFKIGIGGVITFKNSNLKDVVVRLDINYLLIETDSPYLTPEPNRGKKNSPLYLKYIAKYISDIKKIAYEDVLRITTNTASSLFDLDL